jgi:endonuclease IV
VGLKDLIKFMQLGIKLGSNDKKYTNDILSFYESEYFQYIELFAVLESYEDSIEYWKQFSIPIIIHAPHSYAGMNLSLRVERENNKKKLQETFNFADTLNSEYIIFHSGVDGEIEETLIQLHPFIDTRCLIENKPAKGLNGEKCIGSIPKEVKYIIDELQTGFCLDFGHAICTANSLKKEPLEYIMEFITLNPQLYHLTDGDYTSEKDSHFHYGKGTFPLKKLFKMIPEEAKMTNEARHDSDNNLNGFKEDYSYVKNI